MARPFWADGVRFECQGSGRCCTSRGEYGYVYLTREDRRRLAAHFGVTVRDFLREHATRAGGYWRLKDPPGPDCAYLDGTRCSVYEARPTQCRTWPFWPDVMTPKRWAGEVAAYCPGVGKGRLVPASEIRALLQAQRAADADILGPEP